MSDLMVVPQKEIKSPTLVLCPATWDGLASSVILTRHLDGVDYQLYCDEDNVASVIDYPVLTKSPKRRSLVVAGLPLPENQIQKVISVFSSDGIDQVTWYCHHFMSDVAAKTLSDTGVKVVIGNEFGTTSELLLAALKINDELSKKITTSILTGPESGSEYVPWLYLMLALYMEHYSVRHALKPLIEGRTAEFDKKLFKSGKEFYSQLKEATDSSVHFKTDWQGRQAAVVGLPLSFKPYFRIAASLIAQRLCCQYLLMFFDSGNQVLLVRGVGSGEYVDFLELTKNIEGKIGTQVRVYDKNILIMGPQEDIQTLVEKVIDVLGEVFCKTENDNLC